MILDYNVFMSYIIVALGNPGEEYELTRHNTGRIVLEEALKAEKPEWKLDKKYASKTTKVYLGKESLLCLEPETFMNKSGSALKSVEWNPKKAEKLIVIHDDLDIGLGSFKISFNRSAGGHNGVLSIAKAIKTEAFVRIRIGISPTTPAGKIRKPAGPEKVERHILGKFKPEEIKTLKTVSKKVHEALQLILQGERSRAMSEFNGK